MPELCHQPLAPGPEPVVRNVLGLEGRKGMSKGLGGCRTDFSGGHKVIGQWSVGYCTHINPLPQKLL